jgi:hypothetical protein
MQISILTKKSTGGKFLRIYIDTPNGENNEELLCLVPISNEMENEIAQRINSLNYLSYKEKEKKCIQITNTSNDKFTILKIESI